MSEQRSGSVLASAVVIDPDPLWLQAVTIALTLSDVSVAATSSDLSRAPELAEVHAADLLLLGLEEEVDNRKLFRLLRRVHKRRPHLLTVVFLQREDGSTIDAAIAGGAYWAVGRRLGAAPLVRAVTQAYRQIVAETRVRVRLTRRELEILRLAAEGRSTIDIARLVWVTEQTIKFHLVNVYRKLGVSNRTEAIRWAIAQGLVRPDDEAGDDPGLGGVREPRRPIKPTLIGGIAVDLPENDQLDADDDAALDAPGEAA